MQKEIKRVSKIKCKRKRVNEIRERYLLENKPGEVMGDGKGSKLGTLVAENTL